MTYKERFVASLKTNGRVLREHDGIVTIPFGTEYSIYLKNLESKRVAVKIHIDGQHIGRDLIVEPNDYIEVERFITDLIHGNKFKFIQKTEEIAEYRGDRVDDGMIRVEFRYEKAKPVVKKTIIEEHHHIDHWHYNDHYWPYPIIRYLDSPSYPPQYGTYGMTSGSCTSKGMSSGNISSSGSSEVGASFNYTSCNLNENKSFADLTNTFTTPLPDEGITVKGSESGQRFYEGCIGELEENSDVIILQLRGVNSKGVEVKKPLVVNDKLTCSSCGRSNSSDHKCCSNCGTALL
jgi:hypothetical protein